MELDAGQFASNLSDSSAKIFQVMLGEAPVTYELTVEFGPAISGLEAAMWLRTQAA